jgi:inorganic pyrophosphatase/exopolyphosphatase
MKTFLYAKQKYSIDEILKWDFKKFSFKDFFCTKTTNLHQVDIENKES